MIRLTIAVLALGLLTIATLSGCRQPSRQQTPAPAATAAEPEPGYEPLETASIGDEEVQTLPTERATAPVPLGPCSWSSAWQRDDMPNPRVPGFDGLEPPVKTSHTDVMIPGERPESVSEIHAEIVIGEFGAVLEATIVHAPEPRWPEAEQAILDAVRQWRYEPQRLGGEPITVCSTLVMRP